MLGSWLALLVAVLCCGTQQASSASFLDNLENAAKKTVDAASNVCLASESCNKDFFNLNNYCCSASCCNVVEYIFKKE
jgi:hypothetical protein